MTGFEPSGTCGTGSDRSANWATTSSQWGRVSTSNRTIKLKTELTSKSLNGQTFFLYLTDEQYWVSYTMLIWNITISSHSKRTGFLIVSLKFNISIQMSIAFCPLNYIVQNNKYQNYKKNFFKLTIKGTFFFISVLFINNYTKSDKRGRWLDSNSDPLFRKNHTVNSARTTAHFN